MLFERHEALPFAIRNHADSLIEGASGLDLIDADLQEQRARTAEGVIGDLEPMFDEQFSRAGASTTEVRLATAVAAGGLYRWSAAVLAFNTEVDRLNQEYETARNNDFGIPPLDALSPSQPVADQLDRHDARIENARTALVAELTRQYHRADDDLDDEATAVEGLLEGTPTDEEVRALFNAGFLPPAVVMMLPHLQLWDEDFAAYVRALAANGMLPEGVDPDDLVDALAAMEALADYSGPTFGRSGPSSELADLREQLLEALAGLDPAAADLLLSGLSPEEMEALGDRFPAGGDDTFDFYQYFLQGTQDPQSLLRMMDEWPGMNPTGGGEWDLPPDYLDLFPDLFDVDGGIDGSFIGGDQFSLNDCWMLAKLNAIVGSDPDWPSEHVVQQPNGSVSVKFYDDDGEPYWVNVPPDLSENGLQPDGENASTWASYYEKAMAMDPNTRGEGYGGLTAGFSDSADVRMTGQESDRIKTTGLSLFSDPYSQVVEAHENGQGAVAVNLANMPFSGGDDDLAQWHVYYVKDVLDNGDVVMGNPWGHSDVTLSGGEFNDYFENVSLVNQ